MQVNLIVPASTTPKSQLQIRISPKVPNQPRRSPLSQLSAQGNKQLKEKKQGMAYKSLLNNLDKQLKL
jgi:hypothetical protein